MPINKKGINNAYLTRKLSIIVTLIIVIIIIYSVIIIFLH